LAKTLPVSNTLSKVLGLICEQIGLDDRAFNLLQVVQMVGYFWSPTLHFSSEVYGENYFKIAPELTTGMPAGALSDKRPESSNSARFPAILLP